MTDQERIDLLHKQREHFEFVATDMTNLVDALQVICWELCQETIEQGSRLNTLRNAVIGLGDALEATGKRLEEMPQSKTDKVAA